MLLLMELNIKQIKTGAFQVFSYVVSCGKKAVIIDPAGEENKLIKLIEDNNLQLMYILNTHAHADHILGNKILKNYFKVPVLMHKRDIDFFLDKNIRTTINKELGIKAELIVDKGLRDGDILPLGETIIQVIHTPGHTPGSVCFLINNNLFTGDTLFVGLAGRTDLIGGSLEELLSSLKKIIKLPPDTVIWPGHDYGDHPISTIADEIKQNLYITDFLL